MDFFRKIFARGEAFLKGMAFDCRVCGQCVLSDTGLICPMSCPKGLRNGPCGGTVNELCEVYPDKKCVWVRIHKRKGKENLEALKLLPSPDPRLFNTSSYLNFLNGKDKNTRQALATRETAKNKVSQPLSTQSLLEKRLKQGVFVKICEVRSPRDGDFTKLRDEVEKVSGHFDAINATAFLNGKPSVSSLATGRELLRLGADPIVQMTCRDHTKTSFISEIIQCGMSGLQNVLCLTGDAYTGSPGIKQVFDMDSSLMLYEASYLRETGKVYFTGQKLKKHPRVFLGGVINPFTTPEYIPIRRLKQKAKAGADFIQTQLILDIKAFQKFMKLYRKEGLDKDLFLIAGIPVIISRKAFKMLPGIPGVKLPPEIKERFENCQDIKKEGIAFAQELVLACSETPGVSGVHLMLFGTDHSILPEVVSVLETQKKKKKSLPQTKEELSNGH